MTEAWARPKGWQAILITEIGMRRPVPFDAVPIMVCKNALKGCKKKGD